MAQVLQFTQLQFENNPVPGFTNPHINNMSFSVEGGPGGAIVPVTVTATNVSTGQQYVLGIFDAQLSNQGSNGGVNTGKIDLPLPQGTYTFSVSSPGYQPDDWNTNLFVCFTAGTLIRTSTGEVAVEDLAIGDLVRTADGRDVPVMFIGRQTVHARFASADRAMPIRIRAGALAENVPARDLIVSPHHAIAVGGTLAHAQALVNGTTIAAVAPPSEVFTYYSIELPAHEIILAEGTTVESFADHVPRARFDNAAEFDGLYPEGREVGEMSLPLAKSARQVPAAIHATIRDRAAVILGEAQKAA